MWLSYQNILQVGNVRSRGESSTVSWHFPSSDSGRGRWKVLELKQKWDTVVSFGRQKIGSWFVAPSSLSTYFLICTWARHFSVRTKKKWRLFVASLSDKKESNITKASQGKGSCEIVASHSLHLIFCFFICKFCWFPLNREREAGCWGKTHCG